MTPAPQHHKWLILALTVINQSAVIGIAIYCFSLFSVPWLENFDISRSQLMLAIFVFQVATGLLSPLLGSKLDNVPLRLPIIIGLIIYSIGLGLLSITSAYWQVIAIYAIFVPLGVILSGTFASQLLINRWFVNNKGLALGISSTGTSLGGVVFPPLVAQAMSSYSISSILLFSSIALVTVLIPLNLIILRHNSPAGNKVKTSANATAEDASTLNAQKLKTRAIIVSPGFWIPLTALLPVIAAFGAIQHNLGIYLEELGHPVSLTGQLLAFASIMMIAGKLLYGKLADHIDHRYLLTAVSITTITTLLMLIGSPGKTLLVIAILLWGLAGGGLLPLIAVVFAARFPANVFGKVIGLVMLFMVLSSFGPIYAGWVYDLLGSYNYAFASMIVLILPGLFIVRWLPPRLQAA